MRKKKRPNPQKFEFSAALTEVTTKGRLGGSFSQGRVAAQTGIDKRTIMCMENGDGNPTLEKLYPVIRLYGADPRPIFYPEMLSDDPSRENLRLLPETCTEKEAAALIPIVRAVLDALQT